MKSLVLFKQWWFWFITTIITALFAKLIRDISVQKRFVSGVLGLDKFVKLWLKKQIDNGEALSVFTTYDSVDNVADPAAMSDLVLIAASDNDADAPTGLLDYYPHLARVYKYMAEQNLSFNSALQKVKDEYFLNKGILYKTDVA